MITNELLEELKKAFTLSNRARRTGKEILNIPFVNSLNEFIAVPKINAYFLLENCKTKQDVQAKVLNWLSRNCAKAIAKETYKVFCRNGCNNFLNTAFDEDDWLLIYQRLGNGVNNDLTLDFIDSEFDLELLEDES